jgi:hypothetical protein
MEQPITEISSLPSVELNRTQCYTIDDYSFGGLPQETIVGLFKDGRIFSHFIEKWLEAHYPLVHISGCKDHDFVDAGNTSIHYDQKTFTKGGCKYYESSMIGVGRKFDQEKFQEKAKNMIYIIVSNLEFPRIWIKIMRGSDLMLKYPKGSIPLKDFVQFFD